MTDDGNATLETYPLDESMIALMEDLNQQLVMVQAARNGALMLYLRQHKLSGGWKVADNLREIVRISSNTVTAPL